MLKARGAAFAAPPNDLLKNNQLKSNRKPARVPPVRPSREHFLTRRGQRPFRALLHDQTQRDEFVADGVARHLRAAVGQALQRRALGLAEDQQFQFFLVGHFGGL